MATRTDARLHYEKACHLGKKEGGAPTVLDDILKERHIISPPEVPLGLVLIPIDQIVGTKTKGRSHSFSRSFYPVLDTDSEFCAKWCNLCSAHLNEGIQEPIKAYEFMNQFYILEGNKRVSVLKYFGAVSVPGQVTRIIPPRLDDKETRIYYEFMDFYSLSSINDIWFSRPGSFAKLQHLVGKHPNELWNEKDRQDFHSVYAAFTKVFHSIQGTKHRVLPGDAFLTFIDLYDYQSLVQESSASLKEKLKKMKEEFPLLQSEQPVSLHMQPEEKTAKKNLLLQLIPADQKQLHVCFIHARNPVVSSWTYAHDLGRIYLEESFSDQIVISCYNDVTEEAIHDVLEAAIKEGNQLIFTTSPIFLKGSLKAAIEHPEVKILNCSLNTSHKYIRTYYARMYEAKFLMGAVAGSMTENDHLGYIADYPIYGEIAGINSFALGAKLVNPRAVVHLEWSKTTHPADPSFFEKHGISIISGKDMTAPGTYSQHFGLYRTYPDGSVWNIAAPVWNWGRFYERMIRSVINGNWKSDDEKDASKGVNYWWGMSSGMVEVVCSHRLPIGTARLISLLRDTISRGDFNPFSGILYSQEGIVQKDADQVLKPEEIITMNWLAENVIGQIPSKTDLQEPAKSLTTLLGCKEEDHLP